MTAKEAEDEIVRLIEFLQIPGLQRVNNAVIERMRHMRDTRNADESKKYRPGLQVVVKDANNLKRRATVVTVNRTSLTLILSDTRKKVLAPYSRVQVFEAKGD